METTKHPLLRLWALGKDEHGRLIRAILLACVGVLGGMLPYVAAAQIVIGLLAGQTATDFYVKCCLVALLGFFLRTSLYILALAISHRATFGILRTIREGILAKLPKLPLGVMIDTPSGKMKQVIVDEVAGMERPLAHLLPEMTSNLLGPLAILVYLFILDWRMALLALVSIPVGMAVMMPAMKGYGEQYAGSVKIGQQMNAAIVEYIGGIEVIKAFNQGQVSYAKFARCVVDNAAYFYNWMKSCQLPISLSRAIAPTTLITILPVGWLLVQGGSLSVEVFITTIILSLGIAEPLLAAMNFVDDLAKVGTTVSEVDALLAAEEQDHGTTPVDFGSMDIQLSHVSFGYHEGKDILHDVSLSMKAGTMTALVGPSGSGKSTIAKLISGFWDVKEGAINLGGYDLREIPLHQLYDQVAFVSQDTYLFDDTVRENIRMGRLSATDAEVEAAAKMAGCDAFIHGLERGYDTPVGGGGTHLSGGERQRITIARAILKDAPVIILDEATAYIDPENEAIIQAAVSRLVEGRTVIVVAHRLSTIVDADQICVIEDGHVAATGTHEELLSENALYREMWQAHIGAKDGDEK